MLLDNTAGRKPTDGADVIRADIGWNSDQIEAAFLQLLQMMRYESQKINDFRSRGVHDKPQCTRIVLW